MANLEKPGSLEFRIPDGREDLQYSEHTAEGAGHPPSFYPVSNRVHSKKTSLLMLRVDFHLDVLVGGECFVTRV